MLVSIVCYFLLFSDALAFNVTIYKSADYNNHQENEKPEPAHIVEETFMFEFNQNNQFVVDVRLKNKEPDVVARVFVTWHPKNGLPGDIEKETMTTKNCKNEDCLSIKSRKLKSISISIQLEKENVTCASQIILVGNATAKKETVGSLCQPSCAVVMDVQNECQENTTPQPETASSTSSSTSYSLTNTLTYVIPSVIVICVIILGIYIIVKKFRLRNSDPAETMELKTYSTNEVLYADLSFVNGNGQPPKHEEESPYAEIIGVLQRK